MGTIRYRAVAKVLCESCQNHFDKDCKNCKFLRYSNVTNLLSFTDFLHEKHRNWIFFNIYEYKKGQDKTRKLECFVKGKNEPTNRTI